MDSIVLSSANAKTSENNRLRLKLSDIIKLENNVVSLSHCTIWYTWKNFRDIYGNTSGSSYKHLPSNTTVSLNIPEGSYSIRDINNYIHHVMKLNSHGNSDDTYGINVYANPVYNRVTVDVSSDFEFLPNDGLRVTLGLDDTQKVLTNGNFNGNNVARIERVDTVLIHCNLVNTSITRDSTIIHSFVPNNTFGNILEIKPNYPLRRRCRNATFSDIEVWFTDQDNNALDLEDKILVELQKESI